MTELEILDKIVNTISGDNDFKIKLDKKEVLPVTDPKNVYKLIQRHKYILRIKNGRSVIACMERTLDAELARQVAKNHSDDVYNELAMQMIIQLACKGIDKIK